MDAPNDTDGGPVSIRVGTNLVKTAEVAASMARFGDDYLRRIYTPEETAACPAVGGPTPEWLAELLAAKEAVAKALAATDEFDYHDVEVRFDLDGAPEAVLTGPLRDQARLFGVVDMSLSLSHDDAAASAVFVAVTETDDPPPARNV